jgi:hypothetical protein
MDPRGLRQGHEPDCLVGGPPQQTLPAGLGQQVIQRTGSRLRQAHQAVGLLQKSLAFPKSYGGGQGFLLFGSRKGSFLG